ncbi:uncharacterized protein PFL1_04852 [Pseudozyma flocculosa PF-1]|uniref:2-oxoisovalerate dehydrogenase subunit alpha n=2 Tax=Pseudozyma flocculosa TaxID=84751 RepID=A0A5C3F5D9_9BASI|nr:uncharacterized protein PFL1_04852 [Pseudozyma flocculosa PF-1]EPQ27714.1 hypothetical protein PFL1_04852 [Pseudozyma flocculosa PF-1]SPO39145.1 probable 2-oxoisovalerate dehydrogenase alpha subunit, mitochondrial precursor [Pseudozyma flocculosa]
MSTTARLLAPLRSAALLRPLAPAMAATSASSRLLHTTSSQAHVDTSSTDGNQPQGHLPGKASSVFLTSLNDSFFDKVTPNVLSGSNNAQGGIPTFRLLDGTGKLLPGVTDAMLDITKQEAVRMYETMMLLPVMDVVLYNAQRQGRISFYMTSHGEEAAVIGSAAGLDHSDEVFTQYREMGVLVWRGMHLDDMMNQVFGNEGDMGKARQAPIHFGNPSLHFHNVSSPLATQLPQAAGAGFALKRTKGRENNVVICYCGEGAASEGDFHAGLNIAATTKAPVIFFVRNNGFAISTPSTEQFCGDGIASRGPGYGMLTIRVDGNDALAVRAAVKEAKAKCLAESRPVLIEAMTYRVGHHSTSDDSSAYRSRDAVENWKKMDNPLHRMRSFLSERGWWNDEMEEEIKKTARKRVIDAMNRAEKKKRPSVTSMFEDIYSGELPQNLKEQRAELARLVKKYGKSEVWAKELNKHAEEGRDLEKY